MTYKINLLKRLKNNNCLKAYLAINLGAIIGLIACHETNKVLNKQVLSHCDKNLYEVVGLKTIVGTSYGCVSRKVLYGPATPLKP